MITQSFVHSGIDVRTFNMINKYHTGHIDYAVVLTLAYPTRISFPPAQVLL